MILQRIAKIRIRWKHHFDLYLVYLFLLNVSLSGSIQENRMQRKQNHYTVNLHTSQEKEQNLTSISSRRLIIDHPISQGNNIDRISHRKQGMRSILDLLPQRDKTARIMPHSFLSFIRDMFIGPQVEVQNKPPFRDTIRQQREIPVQHINDIASNDVFSNSTHFITKNPSNNAIGMNWKRYHNLEAIYDYLLQMEDLHPDLVKVIPIGVTFQGRRILVAKLGINQNFKKPAIFIEAGIHAREWISPATATYFLQQLIDQSYQIDSILNSYDVFILPVANPDGYHYTFTGDRWWRKNRRRNGGLMSFLDILDQCIGVDLNRNFGHRWGKVTHFHHRKHTSTDTCHPTYIGTSPWSESETRAIRDFILYGADAKFEMYISLHSFAQKILYPWSHTKRPVHDWKELDEMARIWAKKTYFASNRRFNYAVGSADDNVMYNSYGNSIDWAKKEGGIKWVFLVELPPTHQQAKAPKGFHLPERFIIPTASSIFEGFKTVAQKISNTLYYA